MFASSSAVYATRSVTVNLLVRFARKVVGDGLAVPVVAGLVGHQVFHDGAALRADLAVGDGAADDQARHAAFA